MEGLLNSLHVPWWNATILAHLGERYDQSAGSLSLDSALSHSYLGQLANSGKIPRIASDLMSVSGVIVTADQKVVLGLRGGHRFSDMVMTIPAGSVEYHTGRNPLFETFYDEQKDEANLTPGNLSSLELLGRVFDATLQKNSLYVFRAETHLSFKQLNELWSGSSDQAEHKELIAIENIPQAILEYVLAHPYDPAKADPKNPANTTPENKGSIVPPGAISLLLYCVSQTNSDWKAKAEKRLDGRYQL